MLLQASSCGLPVVGVGIGSAREFLFDGGNGLVTKTMPHDMFWWWKEYAELVATLATDDSLFYRLSLSGPGLVQGWDEICKEWNTLLKGL